MRPGTVHAVCLCILAIVGRQVGAAQVGKPTPPVSLTVSPEKLDFGAHSTETTSTPQSVTLANVTAAPVTIRDITVSGIDFTESNNCPSQLAPGAQCVLQVVFKPAITGTRIGTVIVTDSDPNAIFIVLTGTGQ